MRALVPIAAGSLGGAWVGWRTLLVRHAQHQIWSALTEVLVPVQGSELLEAWLTWQQWGYLLTILVCWELRYELWTLGRILVRVLSWALVWLSYWLAWFPSWYPPRDPFAGPHKASDLAAHILEDRGVYLTYMAVVAADGIPFPRGSFLLISRPPCWDEIWVAGYLNGNADIVARTTLPDGSDWCWVVVKLVAMAVKPPVVQPDGSRRPPPGVTAQSVNWIYVPPDCNAVWEPDAVEVLNLTQEANLIINQLNLSAEGVTFNVAGTGGDLIPLVRVAAPGSLGPGGHGQGSPANPGGAGLGLGGKDDAPSPSELRALEKAVQQLQSMALSEDGKSKKSKKKDKKRDRKSSKKSKKKKKKKKKRSDSTSSSSSTSRSRSRSSSTSSSSSDSKKPLLWSEKGKDKKVGFQQLTHVEQLRFKKKGDLVAFAAKHPGALTAHFLASVFSRLSKGTVTRSSQLREASVTAWAHSHSGLTEPRDLKEIQTLAEVLDNVNRKEIARAMDTLCQRIIAIQAARAKGGSWEKAEALELINTQRSLASSSMLALTNS